jgi:hypothetical protein
MAAGHIGPCWPDVTKRPRTIRNITVEDVLVLTCDGAHSGSVYDMICGHMCTHCVLAKVTLSQFRYFAVQCLAIFFAQAAKLEYRNIVLYEVKKSNKQINISADIVNMTELF